MAQTKDRRIALATLRRVPAGTVTFGTPIEKKFFQSGWTPRVDVGETSASILVQAELPGLRPEDIQIEYEDGMLTIRGSREPLAVPGVVWHRRENLSGGFARSFTLPPTALPDQITATYRDGILEVQIPKRETTASRATATPVDVAQAQGNLAARKTLLDEFGGLTPGDLAAAGVTSDAGIFSVRYQDRELYPRFQFGGDGRPLPVMAEILALLRDKRTPWEIALWFTAANGWLGGSRPVDLIQAAPARVVEAARHEAEPRVF